MARDGNLLMLPGGWYGKVSGEESPILTLYKTDNKTANGKVIDEIRLEKTDAHDFAVFLADNNLLIRADEAPIPAAAAGIIGSNSTDDTVVADAPAPALDKKAGKGVFGGKKKAGK